MLNVLRLAYIVKLREDERLSRDVCEDEAGVSGQVEGTKISL